MSKDASADGLRGFAALSVVLAHSALAFFPAGFVQWFPWVADPGAADGRVAWMLSLPIVSTLWNGSFAVSVFFVLSGYVLCKRYVDTGSVEVVRSLAARRYLRLGIPVAVSVLMAYAFLAAGWNLADKVRLVSLSAWLGHQTGAGLNFSDAIRDALYGAMLQGGSRFNGVLWTMRVELFGSFLVFGYSLLSGVGRKQRAVIFLVFLVLVVSAAGKDAAHYVAFLCGALIAQSDARLPRGPGILALAIGLYLGGFGSHRMYGIFRLPGVDPALMKWALSSMGAIGVVLAVRGGIARGCLVSRCGAFLGRISYALYLVHLPILCSMGCAVYLACVTAMQGTLAGAIGILATLAVSIACAMAFERWVDRAAILAGKHWLSHLDAPAGDAFAAPRGSAS